MRFGSKQGDQKRSGVKLGFYVFLSFAVLSGISCKKHEMAKPYSYVYVAVGDELSIPMEGVEGHWDISTGTGHISGEGPAYERIQLNLPYLRDTGNYPNISINN